MNSKLFSNDVCEGTVLKEGTGDILVTGSVNSRTNDPLIVFWAANPPTYGTSFSGSGLPFPNPDIAYGKTTNSGVVKAVDRKFSFRIQYPNAYYVGLGSLYIAPHVNVKVCETGMNDRFFSVKIDDGIPFRTLTHPSQGDNPRSSAMFYNVPEREVRSQEEILKSSSYPETNETPYNFWGNKPPR